MQNPPRAQGELEPDNFRLMCDNQSYEPVGRWQRRRPDAHCVKPEGIINCLKIVTKKTTPSHLRKIGEKSEKRDLVAGARVRLH